MPIQNKMLAIAIKLNIVETKYFVSDYLLAHRLLINDSWDLLEDYWTPILKFQNDFSKNAQLHRHNDASPYLHFNIVHPERTHHSKNKENKNEA